MPFKLKRVMFFLALYSLNSFEQELVIVMDRERAPVDRLPFHWVEEATICALKRVQSCDLKFAGESIAKDKFFPLMKQ
ncbi:hypothetical protein [Endozoicomonas sp. YOMI1]|uniref:hypothetical protein n=1 Tax=Endozoicomonas sp. YOMI1 TaxID=2828739 RepID=UPI002147BEC2|nr:hypothetical protein [Endozoicomonas sp. YOMI1]